MKKITTILAIALSFSVFAQQQDTMFIHTRDAVVEIPVEEIDSIVFHRTLPMSVSQPASVLQPADVSQPAFVRHPVLPVAIPTSAPPRSYWALPETEFPDIFPTIPMLTGGSVSVHDPIQGVPGTQCPDYWCRRGTCFWITQNRWACCPSGGTICPGTVNCCPPGFFCDHGRCVRDGHVAPSVRHSSEVTSWEQSTTHWWDRCRLGYFWNGWRCVPNSSVFPPICPPPSGGGNPPGDGDPPGGNDPPWNGGSDPKRCDRLYWYWEVTERWGAITLTTQAQGMDCVSNPQGDYVICNNWCRFRQSSNEGRTWSGWMTGPPCDSRGSCP